MTRVEMTFLEKDTGELILICEDHSEFRVTGLDFRQINAPVRVGLNQDNPNVGGTRRKPLPPPSKPEKPSTNPAVHAYEPRVDGAEKKSVSQPQRPSFKSDFSE